MGLLIEYNRYMSLSSSNITMHNTNNHKMTTLSTIHHTPSFCLWVSAVLHVCMYMHVQSTITTQPATLAYKSARYTDHSPAVYTSNTNNIHSRSQQDSKKQTTKSSNQVNKFCSYTIGSHIYTCTCM